MLLKLKRTSTIKIHFKRLQTIIASYVNYMSSLRFKLFKLIPFPVFEILISARYKMLISTKLEQV